MSQFLRGDGFADWRILTYQALSHLSIGYQAVSSLLADLFGFAEGMAPDAMAPIIAQGLEELGLAGPEHASLRSPLTMLLSAGETTDHAWQAFSALERRRQISDAVKAVLAAAAGRRRWPCWSRISSGSTRIAAGSCGRSWREPTTGPS